MGETSAVRRPTSDVRRHSRYAIGVGSNRGDRAGTIALARSLLEADGACRVVAASQVRETTPVGGPGGQDAYLNGVWLVETDLGPHQLLHRLQTIESALGRVRTMRWGARTLDLDVLLCEDGQVVSSAVLDVPHPRLHGRAFVLDGLAEVAPHWRHPVIGRSVAELHRDLCG